MERPGCVWTHSLLLDISEDSVFFDYRALFFAFIRPQRDKYADYNKPLDLRGEIKDKTLMPSPFKMPSLAHWLHILLKKGESLVFVVNQPTSYYQIFLLSLMNHLPIGILLKMSMCSGTGRIRKYENELFDLQFIVNYRNNLPKITSQIADVEDGIDWCQYGCIRCRGDGIYDIGSTEEPWRGKYCEIQVDLENIGRGLCIEGRRG